MVGPDELARYLAAGPDAWLGIDCCGNVVIGPEVGHEPDPEDRPVLRLHCPGPGAPVTLDELHQRLLRAWDEDQGGTMSTIRWAVAEHSH